jgi:hypothetical protein
MSTDREIVQSALDHQARARDFRMLDLPGYLEWSKRKLADGESEALIAHLDSMCTWLLPEEAGKMTVEDYDDLLDDLKTGLERQSD